MNIVPVLKHFGLSRDPFGRVDSVDRDVFRGGTFRAALEELEFLVRQGEMCLIQASPGSGKTTLLASFAEKHEKSDELEIVFLKSPERETAIFAHIFEAVCVHLNEKYDAGETVPLYKERKILWLKKLLGYGALEGKRLVLIFDEAHRLPGRLLQSVKEITELSFGTRANIVSVVFSGQLQSLKHIRFTAGDVYKRLAVPGRVISGLDEMATADVADYIRYRTRRAGNGRVFSKSGIRAISRVAHTPLDINAEAWRAMCVAHKAGTKTVTHQHVLEGKSIEELLDLTGFTLEQAGKIVGLSKSVVSRAKNRNRDNAQETDTERNLAAALRGEIGNPTVKDPNAFKTVTGQGRKAV